MKIQHMRKLDETSNIEEMVGRMRKSSRVQEAKVEEPSYLRLELNP